MKTILVLLFMASTALAGSLPSLKYRALDNDGEPIASALLYFYSAGTTTPLATYPTEADEIAGTNANANPVVANANGWFGEIFLQTDQTYKVVMKSADAATTYFTVDNINANSLTSSSFQTRLQQAATNPLDQGAVGDGAADESTEVQAAIDAATGVVDLLGKTYRCDSTLVFDTGQNGVTVKNGTLDFTYSADSNDVTITGSIGAQNLLTTNATIGSASVEVTSASGLATDDWLLLASLDTVSSGVVRGEIVQIDSIAALVVTLKTPIDAGYTTANSAYVREITPVKRLRFENVKFIGSPVNGANVLMQYVNDVSFINSTFLNFGTYGIHVKGPSANVVVRNSDFTTSAAGASGVRLQDAINDVEIDGNTAIGIYYGVYMDGGTGLPRRTITSGNRFVGVTSGVYAKDFQYLTVSRNELVGNTAGSGGSASGIFADSPDFRFESNNIREFGGNGIHVDTDQYTYDSGKDLSGIIVGNRIWESDETGIFVDAATSPGLNHLLVSGNMIYGGADGIIVDQAEAKIIGNTIRDVTNDGIQFLATAASVGIDISNNRINNPGDSGIIVKADGAAVSVVTISNNTVDEVDEASDICLQLSTANSGSLTGVVIEGNAFSRAADLDDNIQLAGGAAGEVTQITVTGNHLLNGAYGVGEPTDANNTNVQIGLNYWSGIGTSEYEGTVTPATVALSAANTACGTTCGSLSCWGAWDEGVPAIVSCADGTADHCICYP